MKAEIGADQSSFLMWRIKALSSDLIKHIFLTTHQFDNQFTQSFAWTLACLFALFMPLACVCSSCSFLILNCKRFLFANTGYSGIWVKNSGFYVTRIKIKIIINYSFNENIHLICKAWQLLWSSFNSLLSILISTKPISFIYISCSSVSSALLSKTRFWNFAFLQCRILFPFCLKKKSWTMKLW